MMKNRLQKLRQLLQNTDLSAIAINPGPSLTYLTGLHFHVSERPTVLLFAKDVDFPAFILPELEMRKVDQCEYKLHAFPYNDNPATWQEAFTRAARFLKLDKTKIGVEPTHFRVLELRYMEGALPETQFLSAENIVGELRMQKDEREIACMEQATRFAESALQKTLTSFKPGIEERELASELTMQLLLSGSDSAIPFTPIVASGPNTANPHAMPTSRKINHGDLLLFDYGATWKGYCCDITRTFAVGEQEDEIKKIYQTVLQANIAGREIAKPGICAGDVDAAARNVIRQAGYGAFFIHRTGHGLGIEGHEQPYMYDGNALILKPGMTFTVEPGIYLPNRAGVRIEDNVVITANGARTLTQITREFIVLG